MWTGRLISAISYKVALFPPFNYFFFFALCFLPFLLPWVCSGTRSDNGHDHISLNGTLWLSVDLNPFLAPASLTMVFRGEEGKWKDPYFAEERGEASKSALPALTRSDQQYLEKGSHNPECSPSESTPSPEKTTQAFPPLCTEIQEYLKEVRRLEGWVSHSWGEIGLSCQDNPGQEPTLRSLLQKAPSLTLQPSTGTRSQSLLSGEKMQDTGENNSNNNNSEQGQMWTN